MTAREPERPRSLISKVVKSSPIAEDDEQPVTRVARIRDVTYGSGKGDAGEMPAAPGTTPPVSVDTERQSAIKKRPHRGKECDGRFPPRGVQTLINEAGAAR